MHPLKIAALIVSIGLGVITYQNVVAPVVHPQPNDDLWSAWKVQYGKTYATSSEDLHRHEIFQANEQRVMLHNADPEYTYKLALNQFADLTGEEFTAQYASCTGSGSGAAVNCPSAEDCPTLPASNLTHINWTNTGAVTPVKNQEQCGSCWAFSTTGSLEGLYYLNHSVLLSFSEQQLVDCAQNCYGCDGCWPYLAMEYTAQNGIELEKTYPYNGEQGNCKYTPSLALTVNTGYQCVSQKSVSQMLSALESQPVSIAVEADQNAWQLYSHGIVNKGCGDALDHAVLITGFDNTENAWYVKNSWGASWGMSGYIWISAVASANSGYGVCGILSCGTLPINN